MGGIGFTELIIVLVIIMIIFGAGKIPQIGTAFGKTIKNFKQSMKEEEKPNVPVEDIASQAEVTDADSIQAVPEKTESGAAGPASEPPGKK